MTDPPVLRSSALPQLRNVGPGVLGLLLLLAWTPTLYAQSGGAPSPPDSTAQPGPWVPPLRVLATDAVDIARGPFTLSASDRWWTLGAMGLLVGTAATLDVPAFRHLSARSEGGASDPWRGATAPLARPGEW